VCSTPYNIIVFRIILTRRIFNSKQYYCTAVERLRTLQKYFPKILFNENMKFKINFNVIFERLSSNDTNSYTWFSDPYNIRDGRQFGIGT